MASTEYTQVPIRSRKLPHTPALVAPAVGLLPQGGAACYEARLQIKIVVVVPPPVFLDGSRGSGQTHTCTAVGQPAMRPYCKTHCLATRPHCYEASLLQGCIAERPWLGPRWCGAAGQLTLCTPKAIRTSAFVTGRLACYKATLQNLPVLRA